MTTIVRSAIKSGIITGVICAVGFALWIYYSQGEFVLTSVLINFILFTIVNGLYTYFSLKRAQK